MDRVISNGSEAFSKHYPLVATIVTAHADSKDNATAIGWHMPISNNPPLYGIAVAAKRFTYQLILASREFAVNFMPAEEAELVAAVGGSKGKEMDKFQAFKIKKNDSVKTAAPILKAAYAAYECRLVDDRLYGDHRLLIGEVVAVHWLGEAFMEEGTLNLEKASPVLYMGQDQYLSLSEYTIRTLDREFCAECLKA